jgi:hypothetical protein
VLLVLGLTAVWQAGAKLPPVMQYPHGGLDGPPQGNEGPTDGGDPDELFAYATPSDPQIGIVAAPEPPRGAIRLPWGERESAVRWFSTYFRFRIGR